MFEGIEFTDRYGGRMPSRITGCGACEAMGCYPEPPAHCRDANGHIDAECSGCDPLGWEFVACTACAGTGRIPLWRGLLRVPGIWHSAAAFVWESRRFYAPRRPTAADWWLAIRIAFLYDWLLLHPRTARWAR